MCTGGDPLSADDVATPRGLDDGEILEMALGNSLCVVTPVFILMFTARLGNSVPCATCFYYLVEMVGTSTNRIYSHNLCIIYVQAKPSQRYTHVYDRRAMEYCTIHKNYQVLHGPNHPGLVF